MVEQQYRRATGQASTEPTAGQPAQPSAPQRVLRRPRDDRVLAGVCSGIARYFGLDPIIVRLAFVILTVAGGGGTYVGWGYGNMGQW